jgi:opacity protein-like surface antigen
MKTLVGSTLAFALMAAAAQAQTRPGSSGPATGYAEVVAQSAFGNVTSQSYGGEIGFAVRPGVQIFVEAGRTRDAAPAELGANAQMIAGYLTQTQSGVSFTVKQPVTFGVAGVKLQVPTESRAQPYVLGGFGLARYTQDVHFLVSGTDVTGTIATYGVVLGSDLAGSLTRPMMTLGGGVAVPVYHNILIDLQYRFGRIFASGEGININRAGAGLGVRF